MSNRINVEPSLSATLLVRHMPEGEWLTEDEVAAIPEVAEVLGKTGRTAKSALGEARRRGWVIRKSGTVVRTPTTGCPRATGPTSRRGSSASTS